MDYSERFLNKTQKASVDLLHEEIFSRGWLSSKKLVALKRDNIQALSRACKRRKYAKKGVIIHVEYGWGI